MGWPGWFWNTPEEEKERINLMVGLARDYKFELFKFDGVCGNLREHKQDAFVKMMQDVRKYSPNLILLNHRLNLGKGLPHATTWLWEGARLIRMFICRTERRLLTTGSRQWPGATSKPIPVNGRSWCLYIKCIRFLG
jgi:hypothetical protein